MAASLNSSFSSKKIEQVSSGIKRNGPEVSQEVSVSKRKNIETSTSREVEKSNGISSNRLSYEMNDMSNNNRSQFYNLRQNNQTPSVLELISKCNDLSSFLGLKEIYNDIIYYCLYFKGNFAYKNPKDNTIIQIEDPYLLDVKNLVSVGV